MHTTTNVTLDLTTVPQAIRDDLARSLALKVDEYFRQPGVEEAFQVWLVEYKKRKGTEESI